MDGSFPSPTAIDLLKTPMERGPVINSADHFAALRAERLGRCPNLQKLEDFVAGVLAIAPSKPDREAFVRANIALVQQYMSALLRWAASDDDKPMPEAIRGLTAWDLSEAIDRLEAAAEAA